MQEIDQSSRLDFGAAIEAACRNDGRSVQEIAEHAGFKSPVRLSAICRGLNAGKLRLQEIPGLATALGLRTVDLLTLHLKYFEPTLYQALRAECGDQASTGAGNHDA